MSKNHLLSDQIGKCKITFFKCVHQSGSAVPDVVDTTVLHCFELDPSQVTDGAIYDTNTDV